MIWGLVALATIIVGLPAIAWMATRGMARRPATPLNAKPYHDGMELAHITHGPLESLSILIRTG